MNKKLFALSLTFFLLLPGLMLSAQTGHYVIDNNNLSSSVEDIFQVHGDLIDQSDSVVYQFLELMLIGSDPSSCTPPDPVIDNISSSHINVSWPAISNASAYKVAYLKLNDLSAPFSQVYSTISPGISLAIPNGLVLLAFQSECHDSPPSGVNVVIVDIPAFIGEITKGCHCLEESEVEVAFSDELISIDYLHYPWETGVYQGQITYDAIGGAVPEVSTFLVAIEQSGSRVFVGKVDSCMSNMVATESLMYSQVIGEETKASLSFTGSKFRLQPVEGSTGVFTIIHCGSPGLVAAPSGGVDDFQLFPNPTHGALQVRLPELPEDGRNELFIRDVMGCQCYLKELSTAQEFTTISMDMTQHLPPGIYYLGLKRGDEVIQKRFVKIKQ